MHPLRAVPHLLVRAALGIVPLVVLARPLQRRQRGMHVDARRARRRLLGQRGRAGEGRAHQRHAAEHVRPHQRAPGRDRRAEIVPDHRLHMAEPERGDQARAGRAPGSACGRAPDRRRNRHSSQWCGHSRAGPAPPRGSRPRPAPASPCARTRRVPGSRAAAAGRGCPGSPASSTCMVRPLMPGIIRARMPSGSTAASRGGSSDIGSSGCLSAPEPSRRWSSRAATRRCGPTNSAPCRRNSRRRSPARRRSPGRRHAAAPRRYSRRSNGC